MEEKTPRFPISIVEEAHLINHLRKKRVPDLENPCISMAYGAAEKTSALLGHRTGLEQ